MPVAAARLGRRPVASSRRSVEHSTASTRGPSSSWPRERLGLPPRPSDSGDPGAGSRRAGERRSDWPTGSDRPLPARLATARATLDEGGAALAVLGPQATLDRGYAIVRRRRRCGSSVTRTRRRPGTALQLRVAARRAAGDGGRALMEGLLVVVIVATLALGAGLGIGMLCRGRLGRWASREPKDEEIE